MASPACGVTEGKEALDVKSPPQMISLPLQGMDFNFIACYCDSQVIKLRYGFHSLEKLIKCTMFQPVKRYESA